MMKKLSLFILFVFTVCCLVVFVGCDREQNIDETSPTISLSSSNVISVKVGTTIELPTAIVSDNVSESSKISVTISYKLKSANDSDYINLTDSTLVINEVGEYILRYLAKDEAGNETSSFVEINVTSDNTQKDEEDPVITLSNTSDITANAGDTINLPTALVSDNVSAVNDISITKSYKLSTASDNSYVKIDGDTLVINNPGEYILCYVATDEAGNKAKVLLELTIVALEDIESPIITLSSDEDIIVNANTEISLPTIMVDDNVSAMSKITISKEYKLDGTDDSEYKLIANPFVINEPGCYVVKFTATDEANNSSTKTIVVIVKPQLSAPVVTVPNTFAEAVFSVENLTDGNPSTAWAPTSANSWVNFEYKYNVKLTKIKLWSRPFNPGDAVKKVLVEIDGERNYYISFSETSSEVTGTGEYVFDTPVVTKNIKITVVETWNNASYPGFGEIEISAEAMENLPNPTINVDETELTVNVGETLTLPVATVDDDITLSRSYVDVVSKNVTAIDSDSTTVTFENAGEYYLVYTATDIDGRVTVVKVSLVVCDGYFLVAPVVTVPNTFAEAVFSVENLTDGNPSTAWAPTSANSWVNFEYKYNVKLTKIKLWSRPFNPGDAVKKVLVEIDGERNYYISFSETSSEVTGTGEYVFDTPVVTKNIKITVVETWNNASYPGFGEIEISAEAMENLPNPTINVDETELTVNVGETLTLPVATVDDDITLSRSYVDVVSKNVTAIDSDSTTVTFENAGEYYLVYTATDIDGRVTVVKVSLVVCDGYFLVAPVVTVPNTFAEAVFSVENLTDGNPSTAWAPTSANSWVNFEYKYNVKLTKIKLWSRPFNPGDAVKKVLVEIDGERNYYISFSETSSEVTGTGEYVFDTPVVTKNIKITVVETWNNASYPGFGEIEISAEAMENLPNPTINVDETELTVNVGETLTLPVATVDDDITLSRSYVDVVSKNVTAIDSDSTTVTFENAGEYYLVYTATDIDGRVTVVKVSLVVCDGYFLVAPVVTVPNTFAEAVFSVENLTDGNPSTAWAPTSANSWVNFEYKYNVKLTKIKLWSRPFNPGDAVKKVLVEIDGERNYYISFSETSSEVTGTGEYVFDTPVVTKNIKITVVETWNNASYPGFGEIEISAEAMENLPNPTINVDETELTVNVGETLTLPVATVEDDITLSRSYVDVVSKNVTAIDSDSTTVTFENAGEYYLVYTATDIDGRVTVVKVSLVVE